MRKKDPNSVVADYRALIRDSLKIFHDTEAAVGEERLKKQLCLDALLRIAVGWETFLSDWYIAAINRAPANFLATHRTKITKGIPPSWAPTITFSFGHHPTTEDIAAALDSRGWNVTFTDGSDLKRKAKQHLDGKYLTRITNLTSADIKVIESLKAVRDCLSHRSTFAVSEMNNKLEALPISERALRKGGKSRVLLTGVGKYLYARRPPRDERRIVELHQRLLAISQRLKT